MGLMMFLCRERKKESSSLIGIIAINDMQLSENDLCSYPELSNKKKKIKGQNQPGTLLTGLREENKQERLFE